MWCMYIHASQTVTNKIIVHFLKRIVTSSICEEGGEEREKEGE